MSISGKLKLLLADVLLSSSKGMLQACNGHFTSSELSCRDDPNLTFSVLQLAMRNAIESAFNETTLDDAVGGGDDAKKKVVLMSDLIAT